MQQNVDLSIILFYIYSSFSRGEDQKNGISIKLAGLPKLNPVALSYWTFVLIIPFYYRIMAILTGTGALTFPTVRLPIWKALRNRLPHVVTQSRKSVGSLLIWYWLFNGFLSHFLYFSVQYFSSMMSEYVCMHTCRRPLNVCWCRRYVQYRYRTFLLDSTIENAIQIIVGCPTRRSRSFYDRLLECHFYDLWGLLDPGKISILVIQDA